MIVMVARSSVILTRTEFVSGLSLAKNISPLPASVISSAIMSTVTIMVATSGGKSSVSDLGMKSISSRKKIAYIIIITYHVIIMLTCCSSTISR